MEPIQDTPAKIIKTYLTLQKNLQHIEVEVIQLTNLPINTSGLGRLAQDIESKFGFFRNFLNAEIVSYGSVLVDDLSDIKGRLVELEKEFYGLNMQFVNVKHEDIIVDSEVGSVCESCLNNDHEGEEQSDVSSVYEVPEMLNEVMVPTQDVFHESKTRLSNMETTSGMRPRRRWYRMLAGLMTVGAVLTASLFIHFDHNHLDGFLAPT